MTAPESTRVIRVHVLKHKRSDLLMAVSDDLRGLMVPGRSEEEILDKLPRAIQELLEAEGEQVDSIDIEPDSPADFIPPAYLASAHLAAASGQ